MGCPIKQAWGMSELSPLGTIAPDDARRGGSIGIAVPSTDLKVALIDAETLTLTLTLTLTEH